MTFFSTVFSTTTEIPVEDADTCKGWIPAIVMVSVALSFSFIHVNSVYSSNEEGIE